MRSSVLPADVHAQLTALPGLPAADGPGLALGVYVNGALVHGSGHGLASVEHGVPISPYTLFDIASVSKQLTAACVHQLALTSQVDLDSDLRERFPELQLDVAVTARQCLHHTAGLRDVYSLLDLAGKDASALPDDDAVVALIARQRATSFPPGTRHLYSNSGYVLMSALVQRVTGKTIREYAAAELFGPLGMSATHFRDDPTEALAGRAAGHAPREGGGWSLAEAPTGVVGDGGVVTNLVDLARWVRFLQTGEALGEPLRDAVHRRAVLADGTVHDYASGLHHQVHRGVPTVGHSGAWAGFRAHLVRAPDHAVTIAVLGNRADLAAEPIALAALDVVLSHLEIALRDEDSAVTTGARESAPPLRLGLWRDPETTTYAVTASRDGSPHLDLLGLTLTVRPAGSRYDLEGVPLPLSARVEEGRLVLLVAGKPGVLPTFDPVEPADPPVDLVGDYRSEELDVVARIDLDGCRMRLRVDDGEPRSLTAGIHGEVWHPRATLRAVVQGGRVVAVEMSDSRAAGLRFDRVTS